MPSSQQASPPRRRGAPGGEGKQPNHQEDEEGEQAHHHHRATTLLRPTMRSSAVRQFLCYFPPEVWPTVLEASTYHTVPYWLLIIYAMLTGLGYAYVIMVPVLSVIPYIIVCFIISMSSSTAYGPCIPTIPRALSPLWRTWTM